MEKIKAYIVSGFIGAGKTTFIQNFITGDFFHKRENGRSLVFVFEEGETEYDKALLKSYRTDVVVCGDGDVREYIRDNLKRYHPGRVFAELNVFRDGLDEILYEEFDVVTNTMLIDAYSLDIYYRNMTELLAGMIRKADPVMINRANAASELEGYSTPFRLLNPKAAFLWESPMGYHEKVFGNAVPFDKSMDHIIIENKDFAAWYLDAFEFPVHYRGKIIEADLQIDIHKDGNAVTYTAGRMMITCCINDMAFLGFRIDPGDHILEDKCFYHVKAKAFSENDTVDGRMRMTLKGLGFKRIKPP